MNENYQRALFTLLHTMERDLLTLRRTLLSASKGMLYEERMDPATLACLPEIDTAIAQIDGWASQLGMMPTTVSLAWQARAQLLVDEISIEEMDPERGGRGYGYLGDAAEVKEIRSLLSGLTASLTGIRSTLERDSADERLRRS